MTNEEIAAEFETLFGGGSEEIEEPETSEEEVEEVAEPEEEETTEETESEEEITEDSEQEEVDHTDTSATDRNQARQNFAFAEQRLQIKKQKEFIRNIGKLIGLDDSASEEDIQQKVAAVLLEKQSREQNVPVELLQRLEAAEAIIQENNQIKLEKKVAEDFADLIDEHSLSEEEVNEFTSYLIDNGMNPMLDPNVDIKAVYLKTHMNDIIERAVTAALEKEHKRQDKVQESAPSESPGGKSKEQTTINSVKELDDLFNSMDL